MIRTSRKSELLTTRPGSRSREYDRLPSWETLPMQLGEALIHVWHDSLRHAAHINIKSQRSPPGSTLGRQIESPRHGTKVAAVVAENKTAVSGQIWNFNVGQCNYCAQMVGNSLYSCDPITGGVVALPVQIADPGNLVDTRHRGTDTAPWDEQPIE